MHTMEDALHNLEVELDLQCHETAKRREEMSQKQMVLEQQLLGIFKQEAEISERMLQLNQQESAFKAVKSQMAVATGWC